LAGILSGKRNQLEDYLKKLLVEDNMKENQPTKHTSEIINAVRFIWFVYHTSSVFIISKLIVVFESLAFL